MTKAEGNPMETDEILNMCRLCAEIVLTKPLLPLFTENKEERIVTKQVNLLIDSLISPDDGLPQKACARCVENVAKCFSFITNVVSTQNKLRQIVQVPELKKVNGTGGRWNQFLTNNQIIDEIENEVAEETSQNSIETIPESSISTSNDFVELLVVHPEDVISLDVSNSPKNVDVRSHHKAKSSPVVMYIKEEEELEEEEEEELAVLAEEQEEIDHGTVTKDEQDTVFLDDYDIDESIIELPITEANWTFDGDKETPKVAVDYLHECNICGNIYDLESYRSHSCVTGSECNKRRDFHCSICDQTFKSRLVYQMHVAQHIDLNSCQICKVNFGDATSLTYHINVAHPQTSGDLVSVAEQPVPKSEVQCDICGKITNNLKQHKIYHTIKDLEFCKEENKRSLKKWFLCQKCNKKVFSEANFLFHVAKHEGEDQVQCSKCEFIATNVQEYNMHITSHTGGKYFICSECGKCFFTRSAISDHVLIHMEGSRYMCEICGKRFKTSRSNAQHKLLQHKKYFRCTRCNRGFTHEAKLNNHNNICQVIHQEPINSKIFEPVEKFFCHICNSNIKSTSEVSILFHKAKHDGKEGVACQQCNLMCKNACMYRNHMLTHTNERPFSCNKCQKKFRTKGCLVQHMLVHGDEYKYTCEHCGKRSKKLTTHVNHVNIHTGKKPYSCPDCYRPFRQLSDMKKHRRTHVKYKPETVTISTPDYNLIAIKTEIEEISTDDPLEQIQLL